MSNRVPSEKRQPRNLKTQCLMKMTIPSNPNLWFRRSHRKARPILRTWKIHCKILNRSETVYTSSRSRRARWKRFRSKAILLPRKMQLRPLGYQRPSFRSVPNRRRKVSQKRFLNPALVHCWLRKTTKYQRSHNRLMKERKGSKGLHPTKFWISKSRIEASSKTRRCPSKAAGWCFKSRQAAVVWPRARCTVTGLVTVRGTSTSRKSQTQATKPLYRKTTATFTKAATRLSTILTWSLRLQKSPKWWTRTSSWAPPKTWCFTRQPKSLPQTFQSSTSRLEWLSKKPKA